jgi:hypothetical protein
MHGGKIVLLVFGIIVVLLSFGILAGGGALIWADATHIDSEGFVASSAINIESDSSAVITGPIDIDEAALRALTIMGVITLFEVEGRTNNPSKQIFIGVADESDVETYLSNVGYDEITSIDINWQSSDEVTYTSHPGTSTPAAPTSQTFWTESAHGAGTQTLEWETEVGSHSMVLMNDDGSSGVDLSVVFRAKIPSVFGLSVGLLVGGIIVLLVGGFMVYLAVRRSQVITADPN